MSDWKQGTVLYTPDTQRMPHEDYLRLQAQEEREVYKNFSAHDSGKSRTRVAVFAQPEDAVRCVRAVNACRWRRMIEEPCPTDNTKYPIQIWGPDYSGVSIAWCNNAQELAGATMWCEMSPLPGI